MDKKKLLIGGSIALVVIGLIIGIVIFIRKKMAANAMAVNTSVGAVSNPGNSYAPGQRVPREFPTKDELVAYAIKKNWDNGNEAAWIKLNYDENKGTWQRNDWRFIITGNNPITAKAFKGAGETFNLSYKGKPSYILS